MPAIILMLIALMPLPDPLVKDDVDTIYIWYVTDGNFLQGTYYAFYREVYPGLEILAEYKSVPADLLVIPKFDGEKYILLFDDYANQCWRCVTSKKYAPVSVPYVKFNDYINECNSWCKENNISMIKLKEVITNRDLQNIQRMKGSNE